MTFRWNGFVPSAIFAAVAASAVVPWLVLAAPLLGGRRAVAVSLVLVTATYLAGIAPSRRRAAGAAVAALLAGAVLLVVTWHPLELAVGLGVALATLRSGVLFQAPPARAVVLEAALVGGGLCFARFLGGPGPLGVAFAVWGFFLVQSLWFLVGGVAERAAPARGTDPFDDAWARALAILDDDGLR